MPEGHRRFKKKLKALNPKPLVHSAVVLSCSDSETAPSKPLASCMRPRPSLSLNPIRYYFGDVSNATRPELSEEGTNGDIKVEQVIAPFIPNA